PRLLCSFQDYPPHRDLHSFPTRRSSDLNNDTIIMAFNVEAFGKNDSCVIDVSKLFTTEVTEFSARTRLRARGFDATRSFIEKTKDRKSTRLNSSHVSTSYAVFCLKKKNR